MKLEDLGWCRHFQRALLDLRRTSRHARDGVVARVVVQDREGYLLLGEAGELRARLPGRRHLTTRSRAELPITGDWVVAVRERRHRVAIIRELLPRKSALCRHAPGNPTEEQVLAANVDTVLLVSGLDGDLNLRRIERAVTAVRQGGAAPVVLLNKTDLCARVDEQVNALRRALPRVPVHALSALHGHGLGSLDAYLGRGSTLVLLGSSGTGKSTLVNRLLGYERMKTAPVRDDDGRGRHTTVQRELVLLDGGAAIIDTPGLRELQLWADGASLDLAFPDIAELATDCRFRDCAHDAEPGCAVKRATADGALDRARHASYRKLREELAELARRREGRR